MTDKPFLSVGLVQCTTPDHPQAALSHLTGLLKDCYQPCDLLCFPEIINFIGTKSMHATVESGDLVLQALCTWAKEKKQALLIGSCAILEKENDEKMLNRSFLVDHEGIIRARYDKMHLFDANVGEGAEHQYRESRFFKAGNKPCLVSLETIGCATTMAMTICYDLRQPVYYRRLAQRGAHIFSIPAAFTVPTGRQHWQVLLQARAIENGAFVVAPAQCGQHTPTRQTWGHSMVVDPFGRVMLDAGAEVGISYANLDLGLVAEARSRIPALANESTALQEMNLI